MQNDYAYWRATHPLVFISAHLLMGIIIAKFLPQFSNQQAITIAIRILFGSILILCALLFFHQTGIMYALLVSTIIISWGVAIYYSSQSSALFAIPYPKNIIEIFRNAVIAKINKTILSKEANGFSLAILLGVKMSMDKELVTAYTQLGIIHIIAISGMHLEVLFKNLKHVTHLLPRKKIFLLLELIILLLFAWTYTLMAFASPSIVRAAVFFSIFTIGKFFGANTFMLNTISGGILILLLFDLNGMNGIGLQLSYAAVIGIHLLYKPLFSMLTLSNPIIKFCWSNCCVSLAAQLTTLPVVAIHFHQIAGWVLISNFIMVPLSNFMLYGLGILLLLPYQFSIALSWGSFMQAYILYFNQIVNNWFMQTKAGTVLINMGKLEVIIYYLILLFVYLWLYLRQPKYVVGALASFCTYYIIKLFS